MFDNALVNDFLARLARRETGAGSSTAREIMKTLARMAEEFPAQDTSQLGTHLTNACQAFLGLLGTRVTNAMIKNAVGMVLYELELAEQERHSLDELRGRVIQTCQAFVTDSLNALEGIAELGAKRLASGDTVLIHSTSATAFGVIKRAIEQGKSLTVMITVSSPVERVIEPLQAPKTPVILIQDMAAGYLMSEVDSVIVGSDGVTSTGGVVNAAGTYLLALAAHEAHVPFRVAVETYKFDLDTLDGAAVVIPEGEAAQVTGGQSWPGVSVRNPRYDITPVHLVDELITEVGIIRPEAAGLVMLYAPWASRRPRSFRVAVA